MLRYHTHITSSLGRYHCSTHEQLLSSEKYLLIVVIIYTAIICQAFYYFSLTVQDPFLQGNGDALHTDLPVYRASCLSSRTRKISYSCSLSRTDLPRVSPVGVTSRTDSPYVSVPPTACICLASKTLPIVKS